MDSYQQRLAKRKAESEALRAKRDKELSGRQVERTTREPTAIRQQPTSTGSAPIRKIIYAIGLSLLAVALTLTGATLDRIAGRDSSDPYRTGTGHVTKCTQQGPLTWYQGFGYWEQCTLAVDWGDGFPDQVQIDATLTSADIGTDVPIGEHKYKGALSYVVVGAPHRPWLDASGKSMFMLGYLPLIATPILIAFYWQPILSWYWFGMQRRYPGEPTPKPTGWVWFRRIALLALTAWLVFYVGTGLLRILRHLADFLTTLGLM